MLKVGDTVMCIKEYDGKYEAVGKIGIVKNKNPYVSVEFFEYINGHDCQRNGKWGCCWNFHDNPEDYLKQIKTNKK